ncbi:ankyrin repeat-containing domain protein [Mycena metata]|uniref:Ankyrin repeat-containing domain protein n=1 Tax=Mycena metata TaxID=1033252 RepID=A0AAD7KGK6_9AGAR|nr:ankyrin repeat-containing domain protein [Mycena metata]
MEAIGLAASILQLIQATKPVFDYVKDVRDGPVQRSEIVANMAALTALLGVLQTQSTALSSNSGPVFTAIKGLTTPLDELRDLLVKIGRKVQDPKTTTQKLKGRLTWTLDKSDVQDLLLKVERVKTLVMLAIQNDHLSLSLAIQDDIKGVANESSVISRKVTSVGNQVDYVSTQVASVSSGVSAAAGTINDVSQRMDPIASGVQEVHQLTNNADLRAFSQWISSINFQATQDSFFSKCTPGTGAWFLEHPKFKDWTVEDDAKILWCPGGPGVGKTILASLIVKHMRDRFPQAGIACVFCDYKQQDTFTATELIASILRQLMLGRSAIPESIRKLYDEFNTGYTRPSDMNSLMSALQALVHPRFYLIIDALDECSTLDATRDQFVSAIRSLANHSKVHILITSRDVPDLSQEFIGETRIVINADGDDLHAYITHRLDTEHRLKRLIKADVDLRNAIVAQVTEKAAGMFLLARLHVDSLASKLNLKALHTALTTLPQELHGSYNETMKRVRTQTEEESTLAFQVFLWLTYSKTQLTVGQLEHALAVTVDMNDMEYDMIVDVNIFVSLCGGLVVFEDESSDSSVRLVHYTTQEYFQSEGNSLFPEAHLAITTTCLRYLSFDTFGHQSYDKKLESQKFPLAEYAATNWGHHAGECEEILCTAHSHWILKFLQNDKKVSCTAHYAFDGRGAYLGAHVLARFGLPRLMTMLLDNNIPLDILDSKQCTLLFYASCYGHLPIVELLVERATHLNPLSQVHILNPNCIGLWNKEKTPLHYAAHHKSTEITQFLLQLPGINPDIRDASFGRTDGRTPLSYAAETGPIELLDLLLSQGKANPNFLSAIGRTPLSYASQAGNLDTVVLLLKHPSIQPDLREHNRLGVFATPLAHAAEEGHLEIVEALMSRDDVDVNAADEDGQTPLSYAVLGGHYQILQTLLRHPRIQTDVADNHGMTPLMHAAQAGSEPAFQCLINHRSKMVDHQGIELLAHAAAGGNINIVRKLLSQLQIFKRKNDCNWLDLKGRTALSYAAENGHIEVVQLLLRIPNIQPDCAAQFPGCTGQTPLSYAAYRSHVAIVALLLGHTDVDPNTQDSSLRTPLSYTADNHCPLVRGKVVDRGTPKNREEVIKLLLDHPAMKPALPDDEGKTPLMYSVNIDTSLAEDVLVTQLLLTHYANDSAISQMHGHAMLILAAKRGYFEIVKLLLEVHSVGPDPKDGELRTPLSYAAEKGPIETVKVLILYGADPNSPDENQQTPFCHAARRGHSDVVLALLMVPNIHAGQADKHELTPLMHSFVSYPYTTKTTEILLEHYGKDPELLEAHRGDMLIVAAGIGNSEMVLCLLDVHHVIPDFKDKRGRTALSWAAANGHSSIVSLLLCRSHVDPNSKDFYDNAPLHYAQKEGHTGIEALLRQYGAVEHLNNDFLEAEDHDDCQDMWDLLYNE